MVQTLKEHGLNHLGAALLQSLLLTAAIGVVLRVSQVLQVWIVIVGAIALGIPALISIQRSWLKFLWARKLVAARRFAADHSTSIDAQYELGILEATRGHLERARRAFDAALAILPSHAPSLVGHGHLAAQNGNLGEALEFFKRAADIDGKLFSAHFGMGTVLQAREQYARSIAAFERALEIDPTDGPTLSEIGRNHLALGDVGKAREFHQEASHCGYRDSELERALRDLASE